jgi:tetratricopeptide (TPR) repeat protein
LMLMQFINNSVIIVAVLIFALTSSIAAISIKNNQKVYSLDILRKKVPSLFLSILFFISVLSAAIFGFKIYLADINAGKALAAEDNHSKIELMKKAARLAPYQDRYYYELSSFLFIQAYLEIENGRYELSRDYFLESIEYGNKALDLNKNNYKTVKLLALIYENASIINPDYLENSQNLYRRLSELEPANPLSYHKLGLLSLLKANSKEESEKIISYNEALKNFEEAIKRKVDFAPAYYSMAIAYEAMGKDNDALELINYALMHDKNNLKYIFEVGRFYFNRGMFVSSNQEAEDYEEFDENIENLEWNEYLQIAEQSFLKVLQEDKFNTNALYSLGLLYAKVGENENSKIVINSLLDIVDDEEQIDIINLQFSNILNN